MMDAFQSFLHVKPLDIVGGVTLLSYYQPNETHEAIYLKVRDKESRLLSDELVKQLPVLPNYAEHFQEWQLRRQTAEQFYDFIICLKQKVTILDLGCGNGWFSSKIASIPTTIVLGIDMNLLELQQASRLFVSENLRFYYGNIFEELFTANCFDIIVLNASIQYFFSIPQLFTLLFQLLKPNGEIHILDTPFYEQDELDKAKSRTDFYYKSLGFPEMANHYFHHSFQDLTPYSHYFRKKITRWNKIFFKHKNPFPWIIIKS